MALNVNREVSDAFYRYKMPCLIAKVEGKGNGIKTVIANMPEISKALGRPPTYATKYFGCELGAQTLFDFKNERYIVNGAHDAPKLQDLLDGFIKKYVLCAECENPETTLVVKKSMIYQKCTACGHQATADMTHRLSTFILRNPPDQEPGAPSGGSKKDKKNKRSKKVGDNAENENGTGAEGDTSTTSEPSGQNNESGVELNFQEQAAAMRADVGADLQISVPAADHDRDDDDWVVDTSERAVKARMEQLSSAVKAMAMSDDLERTPQERVDLFFQFVKSKQASGKLLGKELLAEANRLDIKDKAPMILAEVLMNQNIIKQIEEYRLLFLVFTHENTKAQKYLMGAFEQLVGEVYKDVLMAQVPHILKAFYDADIIDEAVIIEWHKKISKKYVRQAVSAEIHKRADPFVKWLVEAEEESGESDEGNDSDVEVVYSPTAPTDKVIVKTEPAKASVNGVSDAQKGKGEPEDDEMNIDDI